MAYGYYPGCSLEHSAAAYDDSTRSVAKALGVDLVELDDWNCCGATAYMSIDELKAFALATRNLALAEKQGTKGHKETVDLIAPCAACYLNLKKTDQLMTDNAEMGAKVNECLAAGQLNYEPGRVWVRHLLDVIHDDIGEDAVRDKVVRPLTGLRVAPYYGCQVVRPITEGDSTSYVEAVDRIHPAEHRRDLVGVEDLLEYVGGRRVRERGAGQRRGAQVSGPAGVVHASLERPVHAGAGAVVHLRFRRRCLESSAGAGKLCHERCPCHDRFCRRGRQHRRW